MLPPDLVGPIAPNHLAGINSRSVARYLVDRFALQLPPSRSEPQLRARE